ncbi:MAG: hypothetical protein U1E66_14515 [Rhodospirillales bacterium]
MGPNRDRHEAPPSSVPAPSRTASAIAAIKAALDRHGVPHPLVQIIVAEASTYGEEQALLSLSAALDTVLTFQPICERTQPRPILLFGPPGCGKTLTAAKLVVRARRIRRPVAAVSTDLARAGGLEQLASLMRIADVPLVTADGIDALAAAVLAAVESLVVIDSAGVNLFDNTALREMEELALAVDAEPVLIVAAGGDSAEMAEMAECAASIGCRRIIVSRIDMTRRLGSALAAAESSGLALADVGIGPQVVDGLAPINPVSLARLLLPADDPDGSAANMKEAPR